MDVLFRSNSRRYMYMTRMWRNGNGYPTRLDKWLLDDKGPLLPTRIKFNSSKHV